MGKVGIKKGNGEEERLLDLFFPFFHHGKIVVDGRWENR